MRRDCEKAIRCPCLSKRAAFGLGPIALLDGVLDQAERGGNRGKPYRTPACIAEPALHLDSWTALASHGQMHEPDRLGRAAAPWSGYSRDSNRNIGPRVYEGALRHGARRLRADGAMTRQQPGIDPEAF